MTEERKSHVGAAFSREVPKVAAHHSSRTAVVAFGPLVVQARRLDPRPGRNASHHEVTLGLVVYTMSLALLPVNINCHEPNSRVPPAG